VLSRLLTRLVGPGQRGDDASRSPDGSVELLARGVAFQKKGEVAEAERCYLQILTIDPHNADALNLLGAVAYGRAEHENALEYFESALALAPDSAPYQENVGLALGDLGRLDEALAALRRASTLDPGSERIGANLLYLMRVHPAVDEEECFRAHRAWAARQLDKLPRLPPPEGRCADPERRLRIAYVSGDFRAHAVAAFLKPLFAHRDRDAFEVHCYRTLRSEDARTAEFRDLADGWHDAFDLADDAFAELIREHRNDILVDLSGITRGYRALALARKPAPVQISYLGYLGTMALSAIDYRVTDSYADPVGHSERFHTERLLRLPRTQWAYSPNDNMPVPLPEPGEPAVTFGSFHRLAKLHTGQLALWAELLTRVPGARIEIVDVASDDLRERVLAPFRARGIASDRVGTHARLERAQYWELIRRTHIALDAYPYNGGATTCEALWLGVPVVSRAGRHGFSRSGASVLNVIGLPELVAENDDDYLHVATALALDPVRLGALRRGLRERMRASPLCDGPGFVRDLERAYRQVWREHCADEA
jgi:protein O-GlcNAc transferase